MARADFARLGSENPKVIIVGVSESDNLGGCAARPVAVASVSRLPSWSRVAFMVGSGKDAPFLPLLLVSLSSPSMVCGWHWAVVLVHVDPVLTVAITNSFGASIGQCRPWFVLFGIVNRGVML